MVDVETTGLYELRHSIVSIGAVDFCNPKNQFSMDCRIWDGAEISKKALEVNGFTEEQVRDPSKISLEDAVFCFISWAKTCSEWTLAGENPSFDKNFLNVALSKHNSRVDKAIENEKPEASRMKYDINFVKVEWPFGYRTIDVHTLCCASYLRRGLAPPVANNRSAISLDDALAYVGLQPEPKPHVALAGAILEAEVLHRLLYGKPMFDQFKDKKVPGYLP